MIFQDAKGQKLSAILSNPTGDTAKPIIILCHGFLSSKNSETFVRLEKILNKARISTFRFDFFGHGDSEGKFEDLTISKAVDDVLSAINFLKSKGYRQIGLVGSSFGGMAALIAASKTADLFVLALKCPVSDYLGKIIAKHTGAELKEWKEKGAIKYKSAEGKTHDLKLKYSFFEDAEKISGFEAAKKIKIPTIIVHGDKDKSVPVAQSIKTADLIKNSRVEIIPGADHDFSKKEDFEKMLNLISKFIIKFSK